MLAAIDGDHLAGDGAGAEQIEQRVADVAGIGRIAERRPRLRSCRTRLATGPVSRRVGPGPMALTRMRGASDCAMVCVMVQSAALLRV